MALDAPIKLQGVKLDTSVLDKITAELRPKASATVQKYGWAIAGAAAMKAPVDTGALHDSILAESRMDGDMSFIVQDGVEYGAAVELGHVKRTRAGTQDVAGFVAARPFMTPAVESWRQKFLDAFAELFK